MAFFKFRWPGSAEQQGDRSKPARRSRGSAQTESIDDMRRRARHRLIGASVLVLAGVVGFPLVFDTQPRPVAVDVAIDIPDRNKVPPLALPQKPGATSESAPAAESLGAGLDDGEEVVSTPARAQAAPAVAAEAVQAKVPEAKPAAKPEPKPEHKPEPKPETKPDTKTARSDDAARARALLEGRGQQAQAAAEQGRFIVQVGAFADADKVREVRERLERSGLKTYTQVVDTKDGKRTRVRLGPFDSRADADKAVGRVKSAGLSASVLAL